MTDSLLILVGAVLVHNVVLLQFPDSGPLADMRMKSAALPWLALATCCVLTLTAGLTWCLYHWVLHPFGLEYLQTVTFIVVIAAVVPLAERRLLRDRLLRDSVPDLSLPQIIPHCIVLGVALLNLSQTRGFVASALTGLGAGLGFSLVLLLFTGVQQRLMVSEVPAPFKGAPITLITAGIMSLAFMGFAGLD